MSNISADKIKCPDIPITIIVMPPCFRCNIIIRFYWTHALYVQGQVKSAITCQKFAVETSKLTQTFVLIGTLETMLNCERIATSIFCGCFCLFTCHV